MHIYEDMIKVWRTIAALAVALLIGTVSSCTRSNEIEKRLEKLERKEHHN